MSARLLVVTSDLPGCAGVEVALGERPIEIGRADDCALALNDPRISRRHARVEREGGGYAVVDQGSANGIFAGESRVDRLTLTPGLRFRIAGTVFEYLGPALSDAAAPELVVRIAARASGSRGGEAVGTEFRVSGGAAVIGRDERCDVPLGDDPSVSSEHARVEWTGAGRLRVTDLGSTNGVWIDERRVAEAPLALGQRFRVGDCFLECREARLAARSTTETQAMSGLGDLLAGAARRRLEGAGTKVPLGASRTILLDDPRAVYLVVAGTVEVFTVGVKDGEAQGARSHFVTVAGGGALFGLAAELVRDSGFLATGKAATDVRRLDRDAVERLAREPEVTDLLAGLVDGWVAALSARLTRDVFPRPEAQVALDGDETRDVRLAPGQRARPGGGVVWVPVAGEPLLFVGMGSLLPKVPSGYFPLAPQTWVEPDGSGSVALKTRGTADLLAAGLLWAGLDHFHEVLCECEFINKRLAVVDEYQRLESKAQESEAARDAAYDAIGSVLAGRSDEAARPGRFGQREPVLEACRLVGESLGLRVRAPAEPPGEGSFHDHVVAIAAASRFRTRQVALRGRWWRSDAGPLLACDAQGRPVALLPRGPRSYTLVDVSTGAREAVTAARARDLLPFAYSFYRSLGAPGLRPLDLVRFGARGVAGDLWTLVAMGLLTGVLGAAGPFLIGQMVDRALPQGERGLLLQLGLGLLCVAAAGVALRLVRSVAVVRVETRMDHSLQAALWDRLLELPSSFFRQYGAGDLADRAAGINTIRGLLSRSGVNGVLGAVSSLAYVVLMLVISPPLALVAFGVTFLLVAFAAVGNYLQLRTQRREVDVHGRLSSLVLQLIAGVAKVRVSGAENHAFRVWAEGFSLQKRLSFGLGRLQNVLGSVGAGFHVLASLAIFAAIHRLQSGAGPSLSTGEFVAFYAAFGSFVAAVLALAEASVSLLAIVPFYERLAPILTALPESDESRGHPGRLRGGVSISHVRFRYHADAPWVLDDVSLDVQPGEFVALVGASGSGKSTLLRLLLGFERPGSGAVRYDGQDLSALDARAVRRQIGVVLQESRLLPTDIFRNIVGNSSRTPQDAWEAAEMAGLGEDIRQMPMGLHTVVSEGGGTFSGGQRQRLLIARALVNRPRLIFLDEATSALDNKAQAVVTQSMDRLDATRIVIAHRLSTVVNADRIIYLEGGQVREEGTYQELLARGGLFAQLARRQMA
jgi:NHLM bacteriocin system ABC transporter ATP-binding protein